MKQSTDELHESIFTKLFGLKLKGKKPSTRVQKMIDKDPDLRKMDKDIDKKIKKLMKKWKDHEPTLV